LRHNFRLRSTAADDPAAALAARARPSVGGPGTRHEDAPILRRAGGLCGGANAQVGAIRRCVGAHAPTEPAYLPAVLARTRNAVKGPQLVSNIESVLTGIHGGRAWRRVRPSLLPALAQEAFDVLGELAEPASYRAWGGPNGPADHLSASF
jgi:hypothetical protein